MHGLAPMTITMTESNPDLHSAVCASSFTESNPRRTVVRHSRDLEGAIYALLQAVRIFTDADVTSTEPMLTDDELEALAGQMIQDLISKLNRKRMFQYMFNFQQLLGFPTGYWEDTGDDRHDRWWLRGSETTEPRD